MEKRVGTFEVLVSYPYPVGIQIKDANGNKIIFSHKDLSDLKHIVEEAAKEARRLLPDSDKSEV